MTVSLERPTPPLSGCETAYQRLPEWFRDPRISRHERIYSFGEVPRLEAHSVERKLAAIFAADVEGYSRLMGLDDATTVCGIALSYRDHSSRRGPGWLRIRRRKPTARVEPA